MDFEGTLDARTVICVLTHDAKFDVPLLEVALRLDVGYIGAMNDVLAICKQIETARYGKRPGQDDDAARD